MAIQKRRATFVTTGALAIALGAASAALGADTKPAASDYGTPPPPPAVSAGLVNDWLRERSEAWKVWDIGGQVRARFEAKDGFAVAGTPGAVDFSKNSPENNYLLLRERVHIGYTPCSWFTVFGEGQNSSSTGDERDPNPESDGPFDLRQAFVRLGNAKDFPVSAKVGRQELSYGDERLVGSFDWNNISRVFDAAKLRYENEDFWAEAFTGNVVIPDDNNFNQRNWHDWFSGVYASTRKVFPEQETQLFFLADNVGDDSARVVGTGVNGNSPRDIYTFGFRAKSLPGQFEGWDYDAELAGQIGNFAFSAAGPRLDHTAFAAHIAGGHTWTNAWGTPRAGLEYNYASGDDDPADGDHGTFVNLYPTNHKFYGYMDFFSWQNMHNARLATSVKPLKPLSVTLDYHLFWLADTGDFFYQANGQPRNSGGYGINTGAGNFAGHELDLIATYSFKTYGTLQAGYGHYFAGDYVKDSLGNLATDADWFYVQATINF